MFEQAFKNIDDVLWNDAVCTSELDYTEQTSWLLFLKHLDALEADRATAAALNGKSYTHILDKPYCWATWAAPRARIGKIDHNTALTGDDLIGFVNGKLFPYLHGFKSKADFAFVLHALSYLSGKGRAAIVCFPGIFYRGGAEQKIRQYLVDNNYVVTVISLAPNLFFGTTIAVNILVLSKHKTDTKTQFIDTGGLFKKETNNNVLTEQHIEAKDNREVVDITRLNAELKTTVAKIDRLRADIDAIVAEIEGCSHE